MLVKLGKVHPLPRLVVEYRKVHAIVQNIMCPLLQAATFTDASGTFVRSFIHPEPPFFLVINRKKNVERSGTDRRPVPVPHRDGPHQHRPAQPAAHPTALRPHRRPGGGAVPFYSLMKYKIN